MSKPRHPSSGRQTVYPHSIKLPLALEERVRRCMERENLRTFSDFALAALTRHCRALEREHAAETGQLSAD